MSRGRIGSINRDTDQTERKYQAFLEVQAHPAAATRASQVASHLWARYSQVYETIEEPPKLNPLAILRFKHKTAEQDEARARYKEERAELDKEPTSFPSVWTQGGPPSSASLGGRTKPRSTGVSTKDARSSTSIKSGKTNYVTAPGWQYTVDDASAYRAAGGRVQYHMPQQAIDTAIIRSVDSLPVTQANRSHAGGDDFNPSSDAHAIDLGSSLGSQGRRSIGLDGDHQPVFNGNLRSTSMLSVNGATSNSPGSSRMDLARTSSIEAGHANRSPSVSTVCVGQLLTGQTRRHVRRTRQNPSHQSMSVLPQSLAHPIDSWKSWTDGRRQHTMPHSGSATPLGADSGVDEPIKTKRSIHHIDTPSRIMPPRSTPLAPTRPRAAMRFHATPLREQETAPVSDEEQRHRSFRQFAESAKAKLFVGQNKVPTTPGGSPSKHSARDPIKETERLTAVREAEMHFEERIGGDHGPTERRKRAEAQLESYEQRIYRDRQT